jgi:hypothetical protein
VPDQMNAAGRRDLALRRSVLVQRSTCPSLGDAKLGCDMFDASTTSGGV